MAFDISDKWAIQEDFLFSTQGAKIKEVGNKTAIKLSYVNIPIVLQYHSTIGFYLEVGPQFNLLIDDFDDVDHKDFAETIDLGAVGGIGYHFNKEGNLKGLGIGIRYYMGLSKVSEFKFSDVQNEDYEQGVFQMSLFYIF